MPELTSEHHLGQLAAVCVCSSPETSTANQAEKVMEVPMDHKLKPLIIRYGRSFADWLNHNAFRIVVILSLMHIGLGYIHTRRSGRADSFPHHPALAG